MNIAIVGTGYVGGPAPQVPSRSILWRRSSAARRPAAHKTEPRSSLRASRVSAHMGNDRCREIAAGFEDSAIGC